MRLWVLCLLLMVVCSAHPARILAILPMIAKSHHILFHSVLKSLVSKGHHVTSYTTIPLAKPLNNYTEIFLENIVSAEKAISADQLKVVLNLSPIAFSTMLFKEGRRIIEKTFENNKIQELIKSKEHFDLIFLETSFAQEPLLAFGHKFKAPVITLHPFGSFSLINTIIGNPLCLAYVPDFSLAHSNRMTFYERAINSYSILKTLYLYHYEYLPSLDTYTRQMFLDPTLPPVVDMLRNTSLVVNNAHRTVHYAQPYTPNLLPVGGIHLSRQRTPLPKEMKQFLDEAKNGVIYFSLGSFVPDHLLPKEYFDNFINVFRRLPQRVMWKTGSDLKHLPDNIMIGKWMPQQDILAHPNVVLFMTHGGILSQHEAISAGVPVVCIPFFGDQPMNARFYEEHQIGVRILFGDLSEESIFHAVKMVLDDPKYRENMKRMQHIYNDQPVSPEDSLVFWVEYVLRHGGAQHLRPASATMPWYQLYLLDVVSVLLLTTAALITSLYFVIKKIFSSLKRLINSDGTLSSKKNS
ncbi:UDP-glycosyltransferase UGT5-like isoform X1 [Homalodisca vitripennis]|uniref:UDP-glycosyltransferase UGT5-like isoform X1 n=1 Tax=Homalodisca vitripennis TaxID=197043 RepID=UPI001EEB5502|nr:UDP-glycosyltransferase UGT5-like isoform X1 [Homalodisca vitripennis]